VLLSVIATVDRDFAETGITLFHGAMFAAKSELIISCFILQNAHRANNQTAKDIDNLGYSYQTDASMIQCNKHCFSAFSERCVPSDAWPILALRKEVVRMTIMSRYFQNFRLLLIVTAVFSFLLLPSNCLSAQSFTVEQIMSSPFPTQLTTAQKGSRAAWVFSLKGAQNVWVADGTGLVPRQVTHYTGDNGEPIASLRLTPDGHSVVYARGTESNSVGRAANAVASVKQPKQQVWIASLDDGEPRLLGEMGCEAEGCEDIEISPDGNWVVWPARHALWIASTNPTQTDAKQLTDIRGSVSSPQWSPDGTRLIATVERGDHTLTAVLEVNNGVLTQIHYIAPSTDRDLSPQWSPDGSQIAFLRIAGVEEKRPIIPLHATPWSLWIADTHSYAAAPIWKSRLGMDDSLPLFGPSQLLFAAGGRVIFSSEMDGWNHLYSIPSIGGQPVLLTPGGFDVEDVSLTADKLSVLLTSNQDDIDRRHVWRVAAAGGEPPRAFVTGETIEWSPKSTGDGKDVVCLGSSATSPALVYRLKEGSRELITKNALPSDFPNPQQLVIPRQIIFKSADGVTIHGQLFVPKSQLKPGPALIYTHGGPYRQMMLGFHYMDYYHNAYAENQYLASLGYTVLSVNYRLGVMYGRDFRNSPNSGWRGAAEYNDVLAGAHYLQGLPGVDPHRIGLWGGSYGGFLTALGLGRNSDIFAAGVDYHGVHDWSDFLPAWEESAKSAPDYKEAEKLAFSSSPNESIDMWKSPVLLIQGDDDRNVPFSQMVTLVQKLRAKNVPFEQIVYPDEIHDFLLWKDFIRSYKATADFFQAHLKEK
jgi:dipeptidyl aminopeptidase/acylaminoacyl peptidase